MPPMARSTPFWYKRYFPSVMFCFNDAFKSCEEGITVMPSFKNPVFEKDFIHLTEESGPE